MIIIPLPAVLDLITASFDGKLSAAKAQISEVFQNVNNAKSAVSNVWNQRNAVASLILANAKRTAEVQTILGIQSVIQTGVSLALAAKSAALAFAAGNQLSGILLTGIAGGMAATLVMAKAAERRAQQNQSRIENLELMRAAYS